MKNVHLSPDQLQDIFHCESALIYNQLIGIKNWLKMYSDLVLKKVPDVVFVDLMRDLDEIICLVGEL